MALTGVQVYRLFGGSADSAGRHSADSTSQYIPEALVVGVNARKFHGPKANGHYSFMFRNVAASGATSTGTVWYSNLPDPDPAVDADWVQDASIASIDLTVVGNSFINVGNVNAEWIRIKLTTVTTAGSCWLFVRADGSQNR